jgi:hypothetical protein
MDDDSPTDDAPLIVTLAFDAASQARFQKARDRWFPPERNVVPAHLTLFHHLPGDALGLVRDRLASVMSLGNGAAFRVEVPGLKGLRGRIGAGFDLTEQDRAAGGRPHVTVQNKVDREAAREALEALRAGFSPWAAVAEGLDLWCYRGGPWEEAGHFRFG